MGWYTFWLSIGTRERWDLSPSIHRISRPCPIELDKYFFSSGSSRSHCRAFQTNIILRIPSDNRVSICLISSLRHSSCDEECFSPIRPRLMIAIPITRLMYVHLNGGSPFSPGRQGASHLNVYSMHRPYAVHSFSWQKVSMGREKRFSFEILFI